MTDHSRCDRCGDVQHDIDVGFSPAVHHLQHDGCGGTYRRYTPGPHDAHGRDSKEVARAQKWARDLAPHDLRAEVGALEIRAQEHGLHGYDALRAEFGRVEIRRQPPVIRGLDDAWIRLVEIDGMPALEMRDPNSGQGGGPETKPRHQYRVYGTLQKRVLPPETVGDAWLDIGVPAWGPYDLPPSAMPIGPVRDYYEWRTL